MVRFERAPLEQQIILVTGATDGIGRQTALELGRLGAHVIVHGRVESKTHAVAEMIRKKTGNSKIDEICADFRSFRQVRQLTDDIRLRYPKLDVLINNAGIFMDDRVLTDDGHETTFQVNFLSPFLLTHRLLGFLRREEETRILNVTSVAHRGGNLDFSDLDSESRYDGYNAYARSKLALILFTYELAERLKSTNIMVNCAHPGVIATKLLRKGWGGFGGHSVVEGATALLGLAVSDQYSGLSGMYFEEGEPSESSPISYDEDLALRLWEVAAEMTGISETRRQGAPVELPYQPA